jgi:tRNA threonylcarbamoyl adenosine modification protein YjeE
MAVEAPIDKPRHIVWRVDLADEIATSALANDVASWLHAGDLLTLSGDLGAGKTTFARALIRLLCDDPDLEVPSPTFTLMQVYETPTHPIVHADLFRIANPRDIAELGWDEATEGALVLVEWPERAGDFLTADRLDIAFHLDPDDGPARRTAILTGIGAFASRLAQAKALHEMLERSGWSDAQRHFMLGDASTRLYERLVKSNGETAILMTSPPRPDGPPVRFGKPYSEIARLAEDIKPFIAIDRGLRGLNFSAPKIYDCDLAVGLALLEDLGAEPIADAQGIIAERYTEAAAALACLHKLDLPYTIPINEDLEYRIPPYDLDALCIEVELLVDWYAPHIAGISLASGAKSTFVNLWRHALNEVLTTPACWTLRDYHSPNIIWLPLRTGFARVGIIDFQDCVLGHPAYDVVSLLQDARVDVPTEAEMKLLGHYARLRRDADDTFDLMAFARAYALLGAQRATKILGIFARLDKRDHKPQYLAHLPRIENYLVKNLEHPVMAELRVWYETYLPDLIRPAP